MIYRKQDIGFYKLCLDSRCLYGKDRLVRENRRTLRYGVNIAGKSEVFKIFEKFFIENLLTAQKFYIFGRKMKLFYIFDYLVKSCRNRKSAVVGYVSEKYIKIGCALIEAVFKIAVRHSKLIEIAQHCEIILVH